MDFFFALSHTVAHITAYPVHARRCLAVVKRCKKTAVNTCNTVVIMQFAAISPRYVLVYRRHSMTSLTCVNTCCICTVYSCGPTPSDVMVRFMVSWKCTLTCMNDY